MKIYILEVMDNCHDSDGLPYIYYANTNRKSVLSEAYKFQFEHCDGYTFLSVWENGLPIESNFIPFREGT